MDGRKFGRIQASGEIAVALPARIAPLDLRDISVSGCGARGQVDGLGPGTRVVVELPDGAAVLGEIRWADGAACGIAFARALPEEAVRGFHCRSSRTEWDRHIFRDKFGRPLPALRVVRMREWER
ncbi:PilZ domain-containing protein [Croceibacterium aestuarii]|uniref:PilZ domain-containing protein n=1 Tax=Croceibacterium aestuarii TaxID=3064139 RepID=UPI00272E739A|nr:PilZ domain-containing protein [Croceibacterium sp. D39]